MLDNNVLLGPTVDLIIIVNLSSFQCCVISSNTLPIGQIVIVHPQKQTEQICDWLSSVLISFVKDVTETNRA